MSEELLALPSPLNIHHSMRDVVLEYPVFFRYWIHQGFAQISEIDITTNQKQYILYHHTANLESSTRTLGIENLVPIVYFDQPPSVAKLLELTTEAAFCILSPLWADALNSEPFRGISNFKLNKLKKFIMLDPFKIKPKLLQPFLTHEFYHSPSTAKSLLFPYSPVKKLLWFPLESIGGYLNDPEEHIRRASLIAKKAGMVLLITCNTPLQPRYGEDIHTVCFSLYETYKSYMQTLGAVIHASDAVYLPSEAIPHYYHLLYFKARDISIIKPSATEGIYTTSFFNEESALKQLERTWYWMGREEKGTLFPKKKTTEIADDNACKVCGAVPDKETGERVHGRGCFTQSEEGGGSDYVT